MAEAICEGHKIGALLGRDRELATVVATDPLRRAVTIMVGNGFSQLPVVKDGGTRARNYAGLKGVVSWSSIGKKIIKPGLDVEKPVSNFMDEPERCSKCGSDALIKDVVDQLHREGNEYVIVVDGGIIQGMVTHYDIAQAYAKLVDPFMDIERIEIALRDLLDNAGITPDIANETLKEVCGEKGFRRIGQISDLEFAQYHHLVSKLWDKLNIGWSKAEFLKRLGEVREVRNRIMHFRSEGLRDKDLRSIRSLREFLR